MKIKITRKDIEAAGTISFRAGTTTNNFETPAALR
jgi:hypothetical protein